MMMRMSNRKSFYPLSCLLAAFLFLPLTLLAEASELSGTPDDIDDNAISSNPIAVRSTTGNGWLGKQMGLADKGINVGGVGILEQNNLLAGGITPHSSVFNTVWDIGARFDMEKLVGWKGGYIGIDFLQVNVGFSNVEAGSAQGYDGLSSVLPHNRSELYQLWLRQELFDRSIIIKVGKLVVNQHFGNTLRPIPMKEKSVNIPAESGLIYKPIFINPSLFDIMPAYYNSAVGSIVTYLPTATNYITVGGFDGNNARGISTGVRDPRFNGYYLLLAELGQTWMWNDEKPGRLAVGWWRQTGVLRTHHHTTHDSIEQNGAKGVYAFMTQRLWYRNPGKDNSGLAIQAMWGVNDSLVLPFKNAISATITAFGLIGNRKDDSCGIGMAYANLNPRLFDRKFEWMYQAYYQFRIFDALALEPVLSYIPRPALESFVPATWAFSFRSILVF